MPSGAAAFDAVEQVGAKRAGLLPVCEQVMYAAARKGHRRGHFKDAHGDVDVTAALSDAALTVALVKNSGMPKGNYAGAV
jgi:hypothetical protein